jgi:hypothetical protein
MIQILRYYLILDKTILSKKQEKKQKDSFKVKNNAIHV